MQPAMPRCLILACGNTLRRDDGVGPWLAAWAEKHFAKDARVRVISRQQWTPDLAAEMVGTDFVVFIDCSIESQPGQIVLRDVHAAASDPGLATHHSGAPELLALASELFETTPRRALLLTIGAGSVELGENFSTPVKAAVPEACALLELAVLQTLSELA